MQGNYIENLILIVSLRHLFHSQVGTNFEGKKLHILVLFIRHILLL